MYHHRCSLNDYLRLKKNKGLFVETFVLSLGFAWAFQQFRFFLWSRQKPVQKSLQSRRSFLGLPDDPSSVFSTVFPTILPRSFQRSSRRSFLGLFNGLPDDPPTVLVINLRSRSSNSQVSRASVNPSPSTLADDSLTRYKNLRSIANNL
jgi:hypothetical protein